MTAPRTWFVTGASAGLGEAIAQEAIVRGDRVVAAARDPGDVAALVEGHPDRVMAVRCDVSDAAQISASIAAATDRFGGIDVLVNNAGYGLLATVEEAQDSQIERQFAVNLMGPVRLMREVLPGMRARGRGMIVNVSSTAGSRGFAGSGYYSASKAALESLTEALAGEVRELGIRAMIVAPGPFRTKFMGRSIDTASTDIAGYRAIADQREFYLSMDATQSGDPERAARIIYDTVCSDDPPMRLPLGGGACATISGAYRDKITDIARSESIAPLADFPEET